MPEKLKEKISNLWIDTADVSSEEYNFMDHPYGEDWDIPFSQTDEEMENEEFAPMMNYRYPLPHFDDKKLSDEDIKKALDRAGAVTLITDLKSDEKYLALTGGGMDMSWDIVKGYVNLGFAPPAQFCRNLPSFAGNRLTSENKEAIEGCRKSLSAQKDWNVRGLERLKDLEATMHANQKQYLAEKKLRK